jgi:hypothetical protein
MEWLIPTDMMVTVFNWTAGIMAALVLFGITWNTLEDWGSIISVSLFFIFITLVGGVITSL